MLTGSREERERDVALLRELRAEAAEDMLRGHQLAMLRHHAVQELIEHYEAYARFEDAYLQHHRW